MNQHQEKSKSIDFILFKFNRARKNQTLWINAFDVRTGLIKHEDKI